MQQTGDDRFNFLAVFNMSTEALFTMTVHRIETELNAIKGISPENAAKRPSRVEGPRNT